MEIIERKKATEEAYLKVVNQINLKQQEANALLLEKARLEGEFRLLERMEQEETLKDTKVKK